MKPMPTNPTPRALVPVTPTKEMVEASAGFAALCSAAMNATLLRDIEACIRGGDGVGSEFRP